MLTSRTGVVTVVRGRHDHLRRQQALLARWAPAATRVVVSMGDPEVPDLLDGSGALVEVLDVDGPLPLAAARNRGVALARGAGCSLLVLLDVDCLPGPECVAAYERAAGRWGPPALLCGPVTYLEPEPLPDEPEAAWLRARRRPHEARPDPAPGTLVATGDVALFWSLSFAVRAEDWARLGGFCEEFTGYGGEDTDLAFTARERGLDLVWVAGADAFHQHHPVSDPPVEHVADILRNGATFARRWGRWPMEGWLAALEEQGLVRRVDGGWAAAESRREGPDRAGR